MTKIGQGHFVPPNPSDPNTQLKTSVANFKSYLHQYEGAITEQEKQRINDKMEDQLSLMDVAARQASRKETRVQEQTVVDHFIDFQNNPTQNNLDILKQDVDSLGESLEH